MGNRAFFGVGRGLGNVIIYRMDIIYLGHA
jgi:hypothetical protein